MPLHKEKLVKKKKNYIGAISLAVFSILAQYELPLMSYGVVFILLYGIVSIFTNRPIYINKSIFLFIIYSLIQQLVVYLWTGTFRVNMNTYLFMVVILFILCTVAHIDGNSFIRVYYVVGLLCSIVVLIQFVKSNIYGIPQSALQILPVAQENQHFWIKDSNRVSGFFTEPQGFCSYILPLAVVLIFKKKFISAIFISAAIFTSTSSQGIILLVFIWCYYLCFHGRNTAKKYLKIIVLSALGIGMLYILSDIEKVEFIFDKIKEINIFGYDIRLTKGFQIYFAMPILDKITGIGFGNLRQYLLTGNFDFFWMTLTRPELLAYITTISEVLVSFGIFGFIFYLNIFKKNIETKSEISKVLLIIIFIESFTQTILFNAWFIFSWLVFFVFDEKENKRYHILKLTYPRTSKIL